MSDLTHTNIRLIDPPTGPTQKHKAGNDLYEFLQVQFSFQKIQWTYNNGSKVDSDSWETNGSQGGSGKPRSHKYADFLPYLVALPQPPKDIATGQSSGKRKWEPIQLVLPAQGQFPTLFKTALADRTAIDSIILNQGPPSGKRLKLTGVRVIKYLPHPGPGGRMGDAAAFLLTVSDISSGETVEAI